MREKLFTLTRSQRVALWQHFKQTDDRLKTNSGLYRLNILGAVFPRRA